jgi:methyl-accepting chemotaxis protein
MNEEATALRACREVVGALEGVVVRAAVGAARTALKLAGIGRRLAAIETHAVEAQETSRRLHGELAGAAGAAREAAETAARAAGITRDGRSASGASMQSVKSLLSHSEATHQRLTSLLTRVREVTGVSRLIGDIADQTRLLALNASIEASRAGAAGRAFAIVANEVRDLAKDTAERTAEIDALVTAIISDLEPARAAIEESRTLAARTAASVESVDRQLATVSELTEHTAGHVGRIAEGVQAASEAMGLLATAAESVVQKQAEVVGEAKVIAAESFAVSEVVDEGHHHLARIDLDTRFHRGLALARELAARTGKLLDDAVGQRRCTLDAVLALEYREIKGAEIASLRHLFDVRRVPPEGFTPPKYRTGYDAAVDVELQKICDDVIAREKGLLFALAIDLNSYGPIHNKRYAQDWTGDPAKDLVGNRVKRFFTDNDVLVRGARVGLGKRAAALPADAKRADFERVGAELRATPAQRDTFMVQTYARDTGALVTVVTAPIFVHERRWGASLLGWTED